MRIVRSAAAAEAAELSELAFRSEAYWGYDPEYMDKFKAYYSISQEFITKNPTVVLEADDGRIGFYGILINRDEISLEYFFIDPEYIGKGYGRLLWDSLTERCKSLGIREFSIVTSPQARDFYVKMGAVHCGEVESLLKKGRMIPRLIYRV